MRNIPDHGAAGIHRPANALLFTHRGRQILCDALSLVAQFRSTYVGTEHLLLALCQAESPAAVTIHDELAAPCFVIHAHVLSVITRGDGNGSRYVPQTLNAKRTILKAMDRAAALNHFVVNPEHLLLSLLELESDSVVSSMLSQTDLDIDELRGKLIKASEHDHDIKLRLPLPPDIDG